MISNEELDILNEELRQGKAMSKRKDEFLDDFFATKEQQLFDAFKDTRIGDTVTLVNIHTQLKSLNALQTEVQNVMDSAKMARQTILDNQEPI